MTFDDLRAAYPDLGLTLYAMEPRGDVVLEIIDPAGTIFTFPAPTAAAAIEMAFPPETWPAPQVPAPDAFE